MTSPDRTVVICMSWITAGGIVCIVFSDKVAGGFDEIWAVYPKKRGKAQALRKWKKLGKRRPPIAEVLAFIAAGKKSREWTKEGGEYIPNGSTFFNGELWADGAESFTANGGSRRPEPPPSTWNDLTPLRPARGAA